MVGLGEVLWDLLPNGPQMGGAPANFACHASALGAEGNVVSRVGDDPLGLEIITRLNSLGVRAGSLQVDTIAPTGTVTVEIGPGGEPHYTICEKVAWDFIAADAEAKATVSCADAVCFGSLAQRSEPSRASIRELVAQTPRTALRIFDVNLRQQYFSCEIVEASLLLCNVLKVNETELPRIAQLLGLNGGQRSQIQQLAARFNLKVLACTRGGKGSILFRGGDWAEHPGVPTNRRYGGSRRFLHCGNGPGSACRLGFGSHQCQGK